MLLLALVVLVAAAAAGPQPQLSEKELLEQIFGTPPSNPPGPTSPRPEDFTVRSTDSSLTITDASGDTCKCVPYYLCDENLVAVDQDNPNITGWGQLDIRFREDECLESVERCCKAPNIVPSPTPPPAPPRPAGCGRRNAKGLDFTVVGGSGSEAQFGEFPWVVALLNASGGYAGVGSLIHPRVVITAAHVVYTYPQGSLKIHAGEWDTQTTKERLPYQERRVSEHYIHAGFKSKNLQNDVALLLLVEPVALDDHVGLLCLPEQGRNFESGRECIANGWGKDVYGQPGRYAVILKRIVLNMVPHYLCDQLLKRTRLGPRFRLHPSFVCAGGEEGKDTCQGDGGAPLACPVDGRYELAGLVAWGIGCGERNVPAVYAAAANYRQWVDAKMAAWGFDASTYTAA